MIGKYCGTSIPPSHVSSSNEVLIHFQSDYVGTGFGFQMEYYPTGIQPKTVVYFWVSHGQGGGGGELGANLVNFIKSLGTDLKKYFTRA